MQIDRLLTNVCSDNLDASKAFYTALFAFKVAYDSDWFIHLAAESGPLELGIIARDHDIVPAQASGKQAGFYLTFVVADVDAVYQDAIARGYTVLQPPEATFYGQRRMLVVAPEGTVCDVSSPA